MTEEEIIKGCINKNISCQRMLFESYAGKLMTLCLRYCNNRMDAEDVLQDTFIKIYNNIQQYKFQGSFEGWIKKIAVNTALKKIGKKRLKFEAIKSEEIIITDYQLQALNALTEKELLQLVNELPNGYRIVFNLFVLEEYSHEEIGALLNIKPVTSRSQLLKAKKMLQQKILSIKNITV